MREQRSLMRGVNLRNNYNAISRPSFTARKDYLVSAYKEGAFLKDPENRGKPQGNPMSDPAAMEGMMGMMKGNMMMMIPQTLIMSWINAFFSGYVISTTSHFPQRYATSYYNPPVLAKNRLPAKTTLMLCIVKLPFPLTIRFKSMLQSGVMTRDLDVRWVSSLSWYFLNLFGLQSVFIFILGNDNGMSSQHRPCFNSTTHPSILTQPPTYLYSSPINHTN